MDAMKNHVIDWTGKSVSWHVSLQGTLKNVNDESRKEEAVQREEAVD